MEQVKSIGVILAGGTGTRVGMSIPKQLIKIAGKTVLEHTVQILIDADELDEVFILMHPDHVAEAEKLATRYPKVTRVVAGGATRNDTTRAALDSLKGFPDDTKILFHEAVRPFLEHRVIVDCLEALDSYGAVDVAIPSADTIIQVTGDAIIADIPDRSRLRRGQTPQAFRLGVIRRAYENAARDPEFQGTDDCSVVLRYQPDVPIFVVTGSDQNMKITEPIDVFIADKLFQIGSAAVPAPERVEDYVAGLTGKVLVVLGGSYGIGADIVSLARFAGATVHSFSRSETGTHVEAADEVERALAQAAAESGRIDAVVVTAGVLNRGKLAESAMDEILNGIQVNYVAPVIAARAALRYLRETKGHLLLFTSSSYTRGRADYSIYSSSKAAVVNLTQALADEWSTDGVKVNVINPERTSTPMRTKAFGVEPEGTLLESNTVALSALDVLMTDMTGHVIDVRRESPRQARRSRSDAEAARIASAIIAVGSGQEDNGGV